MTDTAPPTPHDELADRVASTRAQLFDTLDAIEDKFNLPRQIGAAAARVRKGVEEEPGKYLTALAGGAVLVGGIVFSVLRRR